MSNMSNHTKVLVLNGPNLARLDIRDHSHYGDLNWDQLKNLVQSAAKDLGFEADVRQSDDEATLVGWLHEAADNQIPVIINPAAFTHYSIAIHDAAEMVKSPLIEITLLFPSKAVIILASPNVSLNQHNCFIDKSASIKGFLSKDAISASPSTIPVSCASYIRRMSFKFPASKLSNLTLIFAEESADNIPDIPTN